MELMILKSKNKGLNLNTKMEREIKFRAWNTETNDWHKTELPFYGFHLFGECTMVCPPRLDDLQNLIIEQFTGLYDKNKKEIYEGDILRLPARTDYEKHTYNAYEVFWHDNNCCDNHIGWQMNRMHPRGSSAGGQIMYRMIPKHTKQLEIIENIHDNK